MRQTLFESPPFVLWHLRDEAKEKSYYCLAPHSVFGSLLAQAVVQWLGISALLIVGFGANLSTLWKILIAMLVCLVLATFSNVCLLRFLNSKSLPSVDALLHLCPRVARRRYESSFPTTPYTKRPLLTITAQLLVYWFNMWWYRLIAGVAGDRSVRIGHLHRRRRSQKAYQGARSRPSQIAQNLSRLRALTLRKEDSCLHAFSAFAIMSCFVPFARADRPRSAIAPKFIGTYFSPVIFGFSCCLVIFLLLVLRQADFVVSLSKPSTTYVTQTSGPRPISSELVQDSEKPSMEALHRNTENQALAYRHLPQHFPFFICVFLWFVQSLMYSYRMLGRDFNSMVRNYFDSRPFPNEMTRFANQQMSLAPDFVVVAQDEWLSPLVNVAIMGLAALYAAFLHALG